MKAVLLLLVAIGCYPSTFSQSLHGIILNAKTKAPIPGCSVYLNNTSRGDVSNAKGEFTINRVPSGKYELIASSIGYDTYILSLSSEQVSGPLTIELGTKSVDLEAVIVEPYEKHGWQKWGKLFLDNFIGTGGHSNECAIKNQNAIRFHYSKKNERLSVTATEPLVIENKALGYSISYDLKQFSIDFSTNIVVTLGLTFFREVPASEKRMKKFIEQRDHSYLGSVAHFMRSMQENRLTENGFTVIKTIQARNLERERVKALYTASMPVSDSFRVDRNQVEQLTSAHKLNKDSMPYYRAVLDQPAVYAKYVILPADSLISPDEEGKKRLFFDGNLQVMYRTSSNFHQSSMYLATPAPIVIYPHGGYYPPQELVIGGAWSLSEKINNLLPLDFEQQP
jgi:6-pyruvoyl-tetrahydropterin synthase